MDTLKAAVAQALDREAGRRGSMTTERQRNAIGRAEFPLQRCFGRRIAGKLNQHGMDGDFDGRDIVAGDVLPRLARGIDDGMGQKAGCIGFECIA